MIEIAEALSPLRIGGGQMIKLLQAPGIVVDSGTTSRVFSNLYYMVS